MMAMQMAADPDYRGRVISARFVMFGLNPVGMLGMGALAEAVGPHWSLGIFAIVGAAAFAVLLAVARPLSAGVRSAVR
jgi:hypothetical protein